MISITTENLWGEGWGAGNKGIGAYTDLRASRASLQRQLGNRISIPTLHHTKMSVCVHVGEKSGKISACLYTEFSRNFS